MARVKRGIIKKKTKRTVLKAAKGFRFARSKKTKAAKEALLKARTYMFRDRKNKKRVMRRTAIVKVNAGVRANGFANYSTFIKSLKEKGVDLNRPVLARLAEHHPEVFERTMKELVK